MLSAGWQEWEPTEHEGARCVDSVPASVIVGVLLAYLLTLTVMSWKWFWARSRPS